MHALESSTPNIRRSRFMIEKGYLKIVASDDTVLNSYPLIPATPKDILARRMEKSPFLIVLNKRRLAIVEIPENFSLSSIALPHRCSECKRCYARAESNGGCRKISDFPITVQENAKIVRDITTSCRIEKYAFITLGIETCGTKNDSLVVARCEHFEQDSKEPRTPLHNPGETTFSLYNYLKEGASYREFITACRHANDSPPHNN